MEAEEDPHGCPGGDRRSGGQAQAAFWWRSTHDTDPEGLRLEPWTGQTANSIPAASKLDTGPRLCPPWRFGRSSSIELVVRFRFLSQTPGSPRVRQPLCTNGASLPRRRGFFFLITRGRHLTVSKNMQCDSRAVSRLSIVYNDPRPHLFVHAERCLSAVS